MHCLHCTLFAARTHSRLAPPSLSMLSLARRSASNSRMAASDVFTTHGGLQGNAQGALNICAAIACVRHEENASKRSLFSKDLVREKASK